MVDLKNKKKFIPLFISFPYILAWWLQYISKSEILRGDNWFAYSFLYGFEYYGFNGVIELAKSANYNFTIHFLVLLFLKYLTGWDPLKIDAYLVFVILLSIICILCILVEGGSFHELSFFWITWINILFVFGGGGLLLYTLSYVTDDYLRASRLSFDGYFSSFWLVTGFWAYKAMGLISLMLASLIIRHVVERNHIRISEAILYPVIICYGILSYPPLLFIIPLFMAVYIICLVHLYDVKISKKAEYNVLLLNVLSVLILLTIDKSILTGILYKFLENRSELNPLIILVFSLTSPSLVIYLVKIVEKIFIPELINKRSLKILSTSLFLVLEVILTIGLVNWFMDPFYTGPFNVNILSIWPLKGAIAHMFSLLSLWTIATILELLRLEDRKISFGFFILVTYLLFTSITPVPYKPRATFIFKLFFLIYCASIFNQQISVEKFADNFCFKYSYVCKAISKKSNVRKILSIIVISVVLGLSTISLISGMIFITKTFSSLGDVGEELRVAQIIRDLTKNDINTPVLVTPEWHTEKTAKWLAAKTNVITVRSIKEVSRVVKRISGVYLIFLNKRFEPGITLYSLLIKELDNRSLTIVYDGYEYAIFSRLKL